MKDCRHMLKLFYEYLDRELPDREAREFAEHLEKCRACFDRAEFERQVFWVLNRKRKGLIGELLPRQGDVCATVGGQVRVNGEQQVTLGADDR